MLTILGLVVELRMTGAVRVDVKMRELKIPVVASVMGSRSVGLGVVVMNVIIGDAIVDIIF